ncbi:MAG: hypothetical protein A2Y59_00685 [Chloroflexi bacterium RBG_13_52_14]|nr:MAG: hypothetical protein A2Y59_00685 [Chloroflexi bacterium RBG_13_52_14]
MTAGRIVALVFGVIILLISLGLLFGGGVLLWVDSSLKDDDGYITTRTVHLDKSSYAITTYPADIDLSMAWLLDVNELITIKVEGSNNNSAKGIFIGIADEDAVKGYLEDVEYDEVVHFRLHATDWYYGSDLDYRNHLGDAVPAAPTSETFWQESAHGKGTKTIKWDLETGNWVLVVMNEDGSLGVDVDVALGVKVPLIFGMGLGLLIGGIVALIIAVLMIYFSVRGTQGPQITGGVTGVGGGGTELAAKPEGEGKYPLSLKGELTEPLSPPLWLIKWFLLIPHYFVLFFLWVAFIVVWFISLFAILFTGKYPRGLFNFNVGVLRWTWRVGFYSYQALGTDKYPPFTLKEGGYPADLEVAYPEKLSRGLVLVKWWLLAIPHYIVMAFFWGCGEGWGRWIGLTLVLVIFAAVILLFTGKYHKDLYNIIMGMNRWSYRVAVYAALMTDRYPPFRLND